MKKITPNHAGAEEGARFVDARFLAKKYNVSSRYILQLAEENRLPCIRLGRKCVRFSESAAAEALEGGAK